MMWPMTNHPGSETVAIPPETLCWRLKRALAWAGLTGDQMANRLGVTRQTISRWMNDEEGAPPRAIYLKEWALVCRVPVDWLRYGSVVDPSDDGSTQDFPGRAWISDVTELAPRRMAAIGSRADAA